METSKILKLKEEVKVFCESVLNSRLEKLYIEDKLNYSLSIYERTSSYTRSIFSIYYREIHGLPNAYIIYDLSYGFVNPNIKDYAITFFLLKIAELYNVDVFVYSVAEYQDHIIRYFEKNKWSKSEGATNHNSGNWIQMYTESVDEIKKYFRVLEEQYLEGLKKK